MALCAILCASVCLSGCGTRTVYVRGSEPVRLRQDLKRVKVWVAAKDGKEIPGVVDIPEGYYCLPDPEDPREKVDVDVKPNVKQKN